MRYVLPLCVLALLPHTGSAQSTRPVKAKFKILATYTGQFTGQESGDNPTDFKVIKITRFFLEGKAATFADISAGRDALITYNPKTGVALRVEVLAKPKPTLAERAAKLTPIDPFALKADVFGMMSQAAFPEYQVVTVLGPKEAVLTPIVFVGQTNSRGQEVGPYRRIVGRPFILKGAPTNKLADGSKTKLDLLYAVEGTRRLADGRTLFVVSTLTLAEMERRLTLFEQKQKSK